MKYTLFFLLLMPLMLLGQADELLLAEDTVFSEPLGAAVFPLIDEPAVFPGGHAALQSYIFENSLFYEQTEVGTRVQVDSIWMLLDLDVTGKVTAVQVKHGSLAKDIEDRTVQMLLDMPAWEPAKLRNEAVRSQATVMIPLRHFVAEEERAEVAPDAGQIFTLVEEMPEYPGGMPALFEYLTSNLKYPKEAQKKGVSGTVYVKFFVEEDGSISNAKLMKGIGHGCDEAALEAVVAMPNWKPGMQKGKPVRVAFTLPLRFVLTKKE